MNLDIELLALGEDGIRSLPAGRFCDRLCAKLWLSPHRPEGVMSFSTDIFWAFELAEQIEGAVGHSWFAFCCDGWNIDFTQDNSGLIVMPEFSDFPLAVCRAALLEEFLVLERSRREDLSTMNETFAS